MVAVDPVSYQAQNASAKAQMQFQERMSNTAHQREVADLKKAGLNPVLSAGGAGASTPDGAEGFVGDENAKKFDEELERAKLLELVSKSMNQSAKTLHTAVRSLGRKVSSKLYEDDSKTKYIFDNPKNKDQMLWNIVMDQMQDENSTFNRLGGFSGVTSPKPSAQRARLQNESPDQSGAVRSTLGRLIVDSVSNSAKKLWNKIISFSDPRRRLNKPTSSH